MPKSEKKRIPFSPSGIHTRKFKGKNFRTNRNNANLTKTEAEKKKKKWKSEAKETGQKRLSRIIKLNGRYAHYYRNDDWIK